MAEITEDGGLVAARTELAAVLAATRDAVIASTPLGVIESWNPAAAELYGYAAEEIIGSHADALVPPDRREEEAETLRRIVRGEKAAEHCNTARVTKTGSVVAVSLSTSAIVDAADAIVGMVTVSRRLGEPSATEKQRAQGVQRLAEDVETHLLEDQLQQMKRMEVLGRLAGGVAHDFNNLLAVILNYASFVAEELTEGAASAPGWERRRLTAQRDVGQIQRAAERATDLTHQLLAFARREVIRPRVLDLNEVVAGVEELLRRTLGEDTELIISLSEGLWPILADPGQIEQVLTNLAINASDAMPDGGPLRIDTANVAVDADSVAGGSLAPPGNYVRLRVADVGCGMAPDVVAHAFEPFFTTKGEGGTGLGLATVYGILTQADATIGIRSEPGAGTTFTIMLPVTDEAAAAMKEPASVSRTPRGETVLVVEDEVALREVTERIFTRNGYRVITAANGPDAVALVAGHVGAIHLLLTDVVMPQMLGREVAERIRELRPEIEVLYMSGYARPILASQGRLDPGVALIDKPFSEADLIAKAGQVLNGHFRGFKTVIG
jgi:PAS domain S-box-containing protein